MQIIFNKIRMGKKICTKKINSNNCMRKCNSAQHQKHFHNLQIKRIQPYSTAQLISVKSTVRLLCSMNLSKPYISSLNHKHKCTHLSFLTGLVPSLCSVKNVTTIFPQHLCQMSSNFTNFWQKHTPRELEKNTHTQFIHLSHYLYVQD